MKSVQSILSVKNPETYAETYLDFSQTIVNDFLLSEAATRGVLKKLKLEASNFINKRNSGTGVFL